MEGIKMNNEPLERKQKDCGDRLGKTRVSGFFHGVIRVLPVRNPGEKVFTLIELLVVIAIIGIR